MESGLLTLAQAAARLPGSRGAKSVHPATVCRWILSGAPARDGTRVRLAAVRVGGKWCIRPADLEEFFRRLGEDPIFAPVPAVPSAREEKRATERARRAVQKIRG